MNMPRVVSEEQFLAEHGFGRDLLGEAGLHKTHTRMSPKQWRRLVKAQLERDTLAVDKRAELRAEYAQRVAAGVLRHPTRRERLEQVAAGHPDNPSVQAARRLLGRG